jgi:hypothetical protein
VFAPAYTRPFSVWQNVRVGIEFASSQLENRFTAFAEGVRARGIGEVSNHFGD